MTYKKRTNLYHLQVNLVKELDQDIIDYWKDYKGSKVDLVRKLFREHIGK